VPARKRRRQPHIDSPDCHPDCHPSRARRALAAKEWRTCSSAAARTPRSGQTTQTIYMTPSSHSRGCRRSGSPSTSPPAAARRVQYAPGPPPRGGGGLPGSLLVSAVRRARAFPSDVCALPRAHTPLPVHPATPMRGPQAARALAARFDRVIGLDASEAQLAHAPRGTHNIEFRCAHAQACTVAEAPVGLHAAGHAACCCTRLRRSV
jgi:hypothetical protein